MRLKDLFRQKKKKIKKELIWFGPVFSYSGYAEHNRNIIFQLIKHGWKIHLIPSEKDIPKYLNGKEILKELMKNTDIKPENSICINLIPPPALAFWGKYTILYTTLESRTIHPGFLRRCLQYDEIWVPCLANFQSMKIAGVSTKKIKYCPEGVNLDYFNSDVQKDDVYRSNKFTFLFNGDWSFRKGIDILFKAYFKEFSRKENVRLLMFTRYQGNDDEKAIETLMGEYNEFKEKFYKADIPQVDFIYHSVPDYRLPGIFACADVFVMPTRGEAWGLPISQAMSRGIPAIVPDWGGQMDYCTKENAFLIKTEKFDTIDDKINCTVDFYKGQEFCFANCKDLQYQMRLAVTDRNLLKKKGQLAREDMASKWGWEKAGRVANTLLEDILKKIS